MKIPASWRQNEFRLYYLIARLIFGDSEQNVTFNKNMKMCLRPARLVDLTALFGRNEEEPVLKIISNLKKDQIYIDIGAHIGRYTLIAAEKVGPKGRVVAIEPATDNYRLLSKNIELNKLDNVHIWNIAIAANDGEALLSTGDDPATNSLYGDWLKMINSKSDNQQRVKIKKLDAIIENEGLTLVDLVKIDVEGAELEVLKGAERSLEKGIIKAVLCEVHEPIVKMSDVINSLKEKGFRIDLLGNNEIYAYLL